MPSNAYTSTQTHQKHEKGRKHDIPKEDNNIPVTNPKEMEIGKLSEKGFKIIILRKLSETDENTDKH